MFDKLNILQLAKARMDWVSQRQELLAENIANANTPKYLPKDLKPLDFKAVLAGTTAQPVKASVTNPRHLSPELGPDPFKAAAQKKTYESSPDGNSVVLEEQMVKVSEAKSAYETAAALFQKHVRMLKTALGNRG